MTAPIVSMRRLPVAFAKTTLSVPANMYTALLVGPDGKTVANTVGADGTGQIKAFRQAGETIVTEPLY